MDSGQRRREAREATVKQAFGADWSAALDVLELTELAWHDCYGEISPPEDVIGDLLTCAAGDLATLVRGARLAVTDRRDLRLWAVTPAAPGRPGIPAEMSDRAAADRAANVEKQPLTAKISSESHTEAAVIARTRGDADAARQIARGSPGGATPISLAGVTGRTYEVRTYGCQMNVHDSERISGLLDEAGYLLVSGADVPDVVVFNTCAVRENADNRLYGNLGHLKSVKDRTPGMQIAVGGCLAQKDGATVTAKAPWVDVVFGTHNVGALPALLERARVEQESQVELLEALEVFPSTLPARRESAYSAWVSISVGCDNTCTFCIVPSLRGAERDRRPEDILREIEVLADQGVLEVTLLGQNVNSYGRSFGDRLAFGALLRAAGAVEGIERVRFTSPHPRDFTDEVIEAMAATSTVCPNLHMPLQSGSDRVLRAMRRSYRSDRFLGILDRVRSLIPDAAITTDIIVGFPGETEADFADTLRVVEQARFAGAFTFQYSPRPGTPAATLPDQVSHDVVQERYGRLVALQDRITAEGMAGQVGREVEVLVAVGEGRKDTAGRLSGRARDNRLVHLAAGADVRPGDVVRTTVTAAGPHYLLADGPLLSHRRTRAGDAWAEGRSPRTPGVPLGMPTLGVPAAAS